MNKKLETELVEKYPNLYRQYNGNIQETCMCLGFECGDGWFKLIDDLSAKLQAYGVVASQVKEKFGGLRVYIEAIPSENFELISDIIYKSEMLSYKTCEECGKPAAVQIDKGWYSTICDECREKNLKKDI